MLSFLRAEARWVGAGMLLTGFSGFGQTYFISLSNPSLREAFSLSHGSIGLIYAAATLTSAFILLEFGKIVDRHSTRTSALIVVTGLAGACLLLAASQAWWMLFPAFLGLRLFGQGMMSQVAMTATGRWFEAQRGRAVSIVALGYPISEAILPAITVLSIAAIGWRQTWLVCAAALLLIALPVLAALLSRERVPKGDVKQPSATSKATPARHHWRRGEVLGEWSFWAMLLGVLCPAFMMTGVFFHQLHLVEVKGWAAPVFATGFTVFALTAICSGLVTGALIDRSSTRAMLPFFLVPMACGLILAYALSGTWVIFAMMFLLGLTGGAASTVMGAIWPELYGTERLGEIRALSFSAMVTSSAVSPFLTGYLIDEGIAFPLQLAVMGGYALLASGVMGLIQPRLAAIATGAAGQSAATE